MVTKARPVRSPTVGFVSLGCPKATVDSERILTQLRAEGYGIVGSYDDADVVVVNTCGFIDAAVQESLEAIGEALAENGKVIVTGCLGAKGDVVREAHPKVFAVSGPHALDEVMSAVHTALPKPHDPFEDLIPPGGVKLTPRHYAYLKISEGCNHRCTFCIIPYGRGNSRSVPAGEVVAAVRSLAAQGYAEVVLTGVDITAWGADLPGAPSLGQLVARILKLVPELPRLRLSSIDAAEIDPDLMRCLAEEARLMPHLHLSLQAGDDMILKRMKRRHSRAQSLALVAKVRAVRPDVAFGADLIAGFPTEDEAAFENTLALVEEAGLAYCHVFPFSPRPGVPAARMPQLERSVIKRRAERLRAAASAALTRHLDSRIGKTAVALVERPGIARAEDFTEIAFVGEAEPGSLIRLAIVGHDGRRAQGRSPGRGDEMAPALL